MARNLRILVLAFVSMFAAGAMGQEDSLRAYVFAGPGAVVYGGESGSVYHFGVGAEGFVRNRVTVGAELGYLAPESRCNRGFGVFSFNPAYHFTAKQEAKVAPFITGGYSLGFRDGAVSMANLGAGLTWWVARHHGVRFEFRDHYAWTADTHYPEIRVAWTFR